MSEVTVVSTTGPSAAREAAGALRSGKHVVLLGAGVTLAEEAELKHQASERGLLMLGPGCGTSVVGEAGFGVWNSVRRGPIGIVSTTGSGVQELSCLVSSVGVSHALGVGPRDISQRVNGSGMLSALRFLGSDDRTKTILVAALTPMTSVARMVLATVENIGKPTVVCFLGSSLGPKLPKTVVHAKTLEEAAAHAVALSSGRKPKHVPTSPTAETKRIAEQEYSKFGYGQRYLRGLYSGGMLCAEAQVVLGELIGDVLSNIPIKPRSRLPDPRSSRGHACVDMGAAGLSAGLSPAVELGPRCERILKEAKDWEVGVVLLDVVLGHGAHPNPAEEIARVVDEAKQTVDRSGGYLSVVASIVGTDKDPQGVSAQRKKLEKVGVRVLDSNAQATRMAALIATKGRAHKSK